MVKRQKRFVQEREAEPPEELRLGEIEEVGVFCSVLVDVALVYFALFWFILVYFGMLVLNSLICLFVFFCFVDSDYLRFWFVWVCCGLNTLI